MFKNKYIDFVKHIVLKSTSLQICLGFSFCFHSIVVHRHAGNWEFSSSFCKTEKHAYLFGTMPSTNIQEACKLLKGNATGPTWLGVAKEKYISMDGGI